MNWLDVLVAIAVLWSGLRGYQRGVWAQFFVVLAVVLGVLAALWAYAYWTGVGGRGGVFASHALRFLVSVFAGIVVFGILSLFADRSGSRLNASILGPINRAFGLFVGLIAGVVASALVLLALVHAPLPRSVRRVIATSWCAPRLFALGEEAARDLGHRVPGASSLTAAFGRAAHPAPPKR